MKKYIFTICTGRCGQVSLSNYVNKFSTNTFSEAEPPEPKYKEKFLFSNLIRAIERKTYATDELLGRGKALNWYDEDINLKLTELCKKRVNRSNRILLKKRKIIYFEISKFFIRSYGEKTLDMIPNTKILYLTRHPLRNAISFFNRKKNFERDNFNLNFKKNIFKINNLDLFEKYLWMWIEIKLRLNQLKAKYKFEIIHFKSENIDKIPELKKLFFDLEIEHSKIVVQKRMNTNKSFGFNDTKVDKFFLKKIRKF